MGVYFVNTLVFTGCLLIIVTDLVSLIFFTLYYLLVWHIPAVNFFTGLREKRKERLLPWIIVTFLHLALPWLFFVLVLINQWQSDPLFLVSFLLVTFIMTIIMAIIPTYVFRNMEKAQRTTEQEISNEAQILPEVTIEMEPQSQS